MFPNVRLLVGALFASVIALSCGFGLFAAFRVNHEPLSRLPVGTAPVQFVANEGVGQRAGWGTPFDGQSRLNGPQRGEIEADAPAATSAGQASLESTSTGTAAAIQPLAAAIPMIETAAPRAIAQPAVVIEPAVTVAAPATGGAVEQTAPAASAPTAVVVAPDQTASVPSPSADAPSPPASVVSPTIAPASAAPEQSASAPVPAVSSVPAATVPSSQKRAAEADAATPAPVAKQDSDTGPEVKAAAPVIATQTPPQTTPDEPSVAPPPVQQAEPSSKADGAPAKAEVKPVRKAGAKKDSKTTRKPVAGRRVVVRKRIVRRVRRTASQNTGFSDPVFQSAPSYSGASASRSSANSTGW
jgi:hypothetical protein